MRAKFVQNLSGDTFAASTNQHLKPHGYLVAPNRARGKLRQLAANVAQSRTPLFVDNGNFAEIGKVRKKFRTEAAGLRKQIASIEADLERSIRAGELPQSLADAYDDLAHRVRVSALEHLKTDREATDAQLALQPDALIGAEDLTMACWLSLDIEPHYISTRRRSYRRYNQAVARRAKVIAATLPRELADRYYPVASAVDYNTAFDAGREFASAGISAISMGFGAYMADANYIDHIVIGRRRMDFGANLPARYARTVAVANGFWAGYQQTAGQPPQRFHFLGLGAPIMIPVVSLIAHATPHLTFDATSPIKDALKGGTLYVDTPAVLKVRTRKVAHRLAREPAHRWSCPCPFCTDFVNDYPFDYPAAHRWHQRTGANKVRKVDLAPGGALFDALPLLSEPKASVLRRRINYARVGHNHWVLQRIVRSLSRAFRDGRLDTRVRNIITQYQARTSPPYANALEVALRLTSRNINQSNALSLNRR